MGRESYVSQRGAEGDLILVPEGAEGAVVPIEFRVIGTPPGQKVFRYRFTYRLSPTSRPTDEVIPVEVSEEKFLSPAGLLVREMPAATHGATLVFTFPPETETQAAVLGNAAATWQVVKSGGPEVVLSSRDWLLPGHGAVVSWRPGTYQHRGLPPAKASR